MTSRPDMDQSRLTLWQKAASLAARCHRAQHRKDGATPYVAHPFRVAMIVRDIFDCSDEEAVAAALLHDVIEDTPADYDDVYNTCGEKVADLVAALTKDMRMHHVSRETSYDQQLADASWEARLIKLADVYDNMCDSDTERRLRGAVKKAKRALALVDNEGDQCFPAVARATEKVRELVTHFSES